MAIEANEIVRTKAYQQKRLWCGITGIGLVLVPMWAAMLLGIPEAWGKTLAGLPAVVAGGMTGLVLALFVTAVQAPVDMVARKAEGQYGQVTGSVKGVYAMRCAEWCVGVTVSGVLFGILFEAFGNWWPLAVGVGLLVLALVHVGYGGLSPAPVVRLPDGKRAWLEAVRQELQVKGLGMPAVSFYRHGERSLAGGWQGFGWMSRLYVAESVGEVAPKVAAMLIAREIAHKKLGHRRASACVAAVCVIVGVQLTALLPDGYHATAGAAVMSTAGVMSTMCWLLLFILPAMGRRQVLAADRYLLTAGFGREEILGMLEELSRRNRPDEDLPAAKAYVFHPMPVMKVRRERIATPE